MKYFPKIFVIIVFSSLCFSVSFGQNYTLPDGEYMDTTNNLKSNCDTYNNYYYSLGCKYPKNSTSLLKELQVFLKNKNNRYSGSGYITFHFRIDCEGKPNQKVKVLQTDANYKTYHFDKILVNDLYLFLKTLNEWKIGLAKNGNTYSYLAFITFKIYNGKITNIAP